jgi:CSLREA domain-containing protein
MWQKLSKAVSDIRGGLAAGSGRGPRGPRRRRPGVESLEGRLVPANAPILVNTLADTVVANDGVTSLREAIFLANARPGADVIRLQRAGVHRITRLGADNNNFRGDFDVTGSLTIAGLDAGGSSIEGNLFGVRERLFDVHGPIQMTFSNLALRNAGNSQSFGGAVQALTANITLNRVVVTGMLGLKGGAINAEGGNVQLIRSTISRSNSLGNGGAINAPNGTVTASDSTLAVNTAKGSGGGIAAKSAVLFNSLVTGNNAIFDGGGLFVFGGTAALTSSTVSFNGSGRGGGGIAATVAALNRSTVNNNGTGGTGGGISALRANLTNSTVSKNRAEGNSGGVHLILGGDIFSSTIAFNSAGGFGGGVHNLGSGVRVKNSILALNTSVQFGRDVLGLFDSLGHNLVGDPNSGAANTDFTDPLNQDVLGVDPKLGPLAFNGGPTPTHALLAGSPAIDRGDNAGAPAIDQRGVARPRDGNGNGIATVDIGAFEL